jgi:hypothetical protein
MKRLRKYLVFWIIVLGAILPFASPLGRWAHALIEAYKPPAVSEPPSSNAEDPQESLALTLEEHFEMVDVVNVDHALNDTGDPVMLIQMSIISPIVGGSKYADLIAESIQGLDLLKDGDEKFYLIEFLYGHWVVGRFQCETAIYTGGAIEPDLCDYVDIIPASYAGDEVRWPGRPEDDSIE